MLYRSARSEVYDLFFGSVPSPSPREPSPGRPLRRSDVSSKTCFAYKRLFGSIRALAEKQRGGEPVLKPYAVALAVLVATIVSTGASAQTNVELIIDDSGSMAQRIVGGRKIDVAKQVFSGLIQDLPPDSQIAVRTYGRQEVYTKRDCHDMELMTPFGPNTPSRVLPGVQALKPNGMTPIAASLEEAAKDFVGKDGQNNIIVLLSDGEEDCNGDPCAAAQRVHDAGIHLQVNVIGLNVLPKERTQLQCVANAGGGKYYDAKNANELKVAASEVKERIVSTPGPPTLVPTSSPTPAKAAEGLYGEAIRGGDSFNSPVPIPTGKLFHLDHDQQAGKYDFFSVNARGGQSILITFTTGPEGRMQGSINGPDHHDLADFGASGARISGRGQADVGDQQDGTYLVLIGDNEWPVGKDGTFQVDLVNNYDANLDRAAGKDQSRALEISPGTYLSNYLSQNTRPIAFFKFKAQGGKTYLFKARSARSDGNISLSAEDDDGVSLGTASSPNAGAVATLDKLTIPKDGYIYVSVQSGEWGSHTFHYGIALGEGQVDSPHPPLEQ
jgi:von Willebrand factor type A domain